MAVGHGNQDSGHELLGRSSSLHGGQVGLQVLTHSHVMRCPECL